MKFRDPKTGEVFNAIEQAWLRYECTFSGPCYKCPNTFGKRRKEVLKEVRKEPEKFARLMGYEVIEDENEHWMIADDGDGLVCPGCGEDFCTIIHETDRFKYCPNCGKALLPPMENSDDESDTPTDAVNHPAHYTQGGIECIDAIKAAVDGLTGIRAFYAGNAIKYIWRYEKKNGVEDLDKAIWYINRLEEEIGNG